jgi:SHS2 domain-containing protein
MRILESLPAPVDFASKPLLARCYSGHVESSKQGHREVEHTADWGLEVWAPDLSGLMEEAARGMYELMGVEVSEESRCHRQLEIGADDREQLLVSFLEELLFVADSEELAFDGFLLKVQDTSLLARLEGGFIVSRTKEIKAVTYHYLEISETKRGLETRIIFDV